MIALRNLNTLNINEFDEVWLIMRTLKKRKTFTKALKRLSRSRTISI